MKRIIMYFLLVLFFHASSIAVEVTDTIAFMKDMEALANAHKGEKLSVVIDRFRAAKIPIEMFSYDFTSPFAKWEDTSYLKSVSIYSRPRPNAYWPLLVIYINETNCESEYFEDTFKPYEGNGEERATRFKDMFTIKSAKFYLVPCIGSKKK
mgnify:FL=1